MKDLKKKLNDYKKQTENCENENDQAYACVEVCNCNECFDYCCCCDNCCPSCCG